MILDTECFSMYSDMSNRISDSVESNMSSARHFTNSVLPTPVEPTKIKDTGCRLTEMPTRLRPDCSRNGGNCLVLPHDPLFEAILQMAQLVIFLGFDFTGRDFSP